MLWLAVWYVRKEGTNAAQVDVSRIIVTKFSVFVIGFILMFALSTTGIFAPANHYQGKYFGNTADLGFKKENLLNAGQIQLLRSELHNIGHIGHSAALMRLIEHG